MKQSKLFYKSLKETPKEAKVISHKFLLRGGFISQLASGIYSFLPLGYRVHQKIEKIIREEIDSIGGQEVFLPALHPKELWLKTGRWAHMDPPLFKVKDRHNKEFALGSTHEEVITDLVKNRVQSYKDLPLALYQIQTKFRNEMRFTGGLLRTREFVMKDLYSFHAEKEDLNRFFDKVLCAYGRIYKRCGVEAIKSQASGGVFTKEKTYEFQVISEEGEDKVIFCPKCKWASNLEGAETKIGKRCPRCREKLIEVSSIEVGHTFKLGTKYSKPFNLYFKNKKGERKPVLMGCYGIGLGRLMATIVEINHDDKGMIWPAEVAPFKAHLIQIENNKKLRVEAEKVYSSLEDRGIEVLYDDRTDKTPGEKLAEADLIGIPYRIILSERTIKKGCLEVKERKKSKVRLVKKENIFTIFKTKHKKN